LSNTTLRRKNLSERIGKKRATIANFLRLLKLPAEVQLGLRDKRLDMGHARTLLTLDDPKLQLKLYGEILDQGLSVRRVEELAKLYQQQAERARFHKKVIAQGEQTKAAGEFDVLKRQSFSHVPHSRAV